jgi:hypothetical protein
MNVSIHDINAIAKDLPRPSTLPRPFPRLSASPGDPLAVGTGTNPSPGTKEPPG